MIVYVYMLIILTALTAKVFCISEKRLFLPGSGRIATWVMGRWAKFGIRSREMSNK